MPYADKEKQKEYWRSYWRRNRARKRVIQKASDARHHEKRKARRDKYFVENKDRIAERRRNYLFKTKVQALTHYGRNGEMLCCWADCEVRDPDMLSLDHIDNTGAAHRKSSKITIGVWVKHRGFPAGLQTLCYNHQWKKEILRRRGILTSLLAQKGDSK